MVTFSALLALCAGNSPVTGEFPSQTPVTRNFDVFYDLRLKNGWVNNRDAGDLMRHRAHYNVTVMCYCQHRGEFFQVLVNYGIFTGNVPGGFGAK